jgi:hypothetical protein
MVPTIGAVGTVTLFITALAEEPEVHPPAFVTVNVYVFAARPVIVAVVPVPVDVTLPGVLVSVHVPAAGNPPSTTEPVAVAQVGCVIAPTVGADGAAG